MIGTRSKLLNSFGEIRNKYNYFIFDLDGVVWRENEVIPNAANEIRNLISMGKNVFFLTNSNKLSREDLKQKFLSKCGLDIDIKFIYNAGYITAKYITTHYKHIQNLYLIGRSGLEHELKLQGFNIFGGENSTNIKTIENFSSEHLCDVQINPDIQGCICGYDDYINYFKIVYGSYVIQKTGIFFGTNYDSHVALKNGLHSPGTYTFVSALETCAGLKATVVTKPDPRSLEIIMNDHGIVNKEEILMIGDNPRTDILFSINGGIDSMMVLTGVTKDPSQAEHASTYVLKEF